jgi:hypothetical protein
MKPATMRRAYLREAAVAIAVARLAVQVLPPVRLFAWANRPPRFVNRFAAEEATWIAWAVETAGEWPWLNALCLPRALAAHAMMRRRGIKSRLCLGVGRENDVLGAHAWIEVGGERLVGATQADGMTPLVAFGAGP